MDQRDIEKGNTKADEITAENDSGSQTMAQKPRTRFKRSDSTASIRTRDIDFSKDTDNTLELITFKSLFRLIVIFMLPLGILIAIPIVLACTVDSARKATIGGVPLLQFFIWVCMILKNQFAVCKTLTFNQTGGNFMGFPLGYKTSCKGAAFHCSAILERWRKEILSSTPRSRSSPGFGRWYLRDVRELLPNDAPSRE